MTTPDTDPAARIENRLPVRSADEQARPFRDWRHPGWSWTSRHGGLLRGFSTAGIALIGAALGTIPAVLSGSWADAPTRIQTWVLVALTAAGLASLGFAGLSQRGHRRMLQRNGVAYILREEAREWTGDDSRAFLASVSRQFTGRILMPGPGKLSGPWDWPLGDGAHRWGEKLTELVRSFQAVHFNHDAETPTGIFMWAWWPVALAYGARVTATDRGLVLDVWQRPSRGRNGPVDPVTATQRPHRFSRSAALPPLAGVLPESAPHQFTWPAQVTIVPRAVATRASEAAAAGQDGIVVLLARLSSQPWGPLPAAATPSEPDSTISLAIDDAAGIGFAGTHAAEIRELRCVPPEGGKFPWPCYPHLVREVSSWIRRETASLTGKTVLLGTVMPPEVALGLGIDAGQQGSPKWPRNLWPLVFLKEEDGGSLIVAALGIGTAPAGAK